MSKPKNDVLPFVSSTLHEAVVSTVKIARTSAPAPEDSMGVDQMDAVEILPLTELPVLSVQYSNAKFLTRLFKKRPVSELSCLMKNRDKEKEGEIYEKSTFPWNSLPQRPPLISAERLWQSEENWVLQWTTSVPSSLKA